MSLTVLQIVLVAATCCLASATLSHGGSSQFGAAQLGPVGYQGPLANPVVQGDGHLADTVEVAAARGAHLVAVAKERILSAQAGGNYDDGSASAGHGGALGAAFGGAGAFSYGPGTADVYRGQNGYAGLNSAAGKGDGGFGGAYGGAGAGALAGGAYSYGPGTADVYRGQNGYAGLSSAASGHGAGGAGSYKH